MDKFKLALIQMAVGESKDDNLAEAVRMLRKARAEGADVAALPEMFLCPYDSARFGEFAETEDGRAVRTLSKTAGELGLYLIGGTIPEKDSEGKIYNSCFCFSPDGGIIGRHRKVHLFDIDIEGGISFRESDSLTAGSTATVIDTPWGKIGVAICFDIRFAELFRLMAMEGAHTVVVPAAFNMTTGPAHWELSFRMRAVDNQIYTAGAAPARNPEAGYISYANSIVSDPWGRITGRLDKDEGMLISEIDPGYALSIRDQLPILKGVKPGGYPLGGR